MKTYKPLFIFEMANNHQGDVEHGKRIIREIREVCRKFVQFDYAFKFQYRDLDTFIHPDYKERMDVKNVKRFQETRLSMEQFQELLDEVRKNDFKAICTPFDEPSVDIIAAQNYDYIKIASCSFGDWPLLEKIAEKKMPVIASAAGSSMEQIKNVVDFFKNRGVEIALMHCVAEYPTLSQNLQINQIDYYQKQFPNLRIGFSTHEEPDNTLPIRLAVAKGATIFEKHIGVPTEEVVLNGYSANPTQVCEWIKAAVEAYDMCGIANDRYVPSEKECADLAALKRGVFAYKKIEKGMILEKDDLFLAFPCQEGQLVANDLSKYNRIQITVEDVEENMPIMLSNVCIENMTNDIVGVVRDIAKLLKEGNVVVPAGSSCEISHHYGVEKYRETGVALIDCINREYCKKILVLLPGQYHPMHYHVKKEETFVVLHGDLVITLNGEKKILHKGDVMTVERNSPHNFGSENGCIFEEISTTHYVNDSFYDEEAVFASPRKTKVHFTKEMLTEINGYE